MMQYRTIVGALVWGSLLALLLCQGTSAELPAYTSSCACYSDEVVSSCGFNVTDISQQAAVQTGNCSSLTCASAILLYTECYITANSLSTASDDSDPGNEHLYNYTQACLTAKLATVTPAPTPVEPIRVSMILDLSFDSINVEQFKVDFAQELAAATKISVSRIDMKTVTPGSIIVRFDILGGAGQTPQRVLEDIQAQAQDSSSDLRSGTLGSAVEASSVTTRCDDGSYKTSCTDDGSPADPAASSDSDIEEWMIFAGAAVVVIGFFCCVGFCCWRKNKSEDSYRS